ncbi:hypothetical protein [Kitasatospora phosalacinea]|uniref:Carrier domain-containing protein n=1 Tax=Kitasatospora phosalacinea TaxID=2065 RepID=A0A9W6PHR0_9ACTN|nr:hypothetical protein [Kitasatospora phosalacinea]GLW55052.1 hypothetical protein Kpho01_30630 [Kitasatospora phosalacinea]
MTPDDFYRQLTDFLREMNADPDAVPDSLDADDNLFDLGLMSSFSTIRVLVFLEQLTGRAVDIADHDIEEFYTMRGLYGLFAAETAEAAAEGATRG